MKKFLSMVTALSCIGSMMAVLPASVQANAVVREYEGELPWICRVSLINYDEQNQPESYILSQNMREFNLISAEDMQTYIADGSELPVVGDVLEVWHAPMHSYPSKLEDFVFSEDSSIINQGSDKDYYTNTKEYIVTKKYLDENNTFCWTRLTDPETGKVILYTDYDFYYDSVYSLKNTEIGDTVTCALEGDEEYSYPTQVLSIQKGDGSLPALPEYDVYPESDSAGRFVFQATSSYVVNGCEIIGDSQVFLYTEGEEFPQYGDVYEGKYYVNATYPGQFVPCSMMKKVGTVEDFYPVKEVTVALNHPKENNIVLTDAEGNIYRYYYDTYNFGKWKFDIPIQNLQAGDTLKCAFDGNSVVLVTEILNTSAVETSVQEEDYQLSVCIGTTSYGNHVFTPYTPLRSDTEEKYMNDMSLHYGDVVKFPKSFLEAIDKRQRAGRYKY